MKAPIKSFQLVQECLNQYHSNKHSSDSEYEEMYEKLKLEKCCISAIKEHRKLNFACHFLWKPNKFAKLY